MYKYDTYFFKSINIPICKTKFRNPHDSCELGGKWTNLTQYIYDICIDQVFVGVLLLTVGRLMESLWDLLVVVVREDVVFIRVTIYI